MKESRLHTSVFQTDSASGAYLEELVWVGGRLWLLPLELVGSGACRNLSAMGWFPIAAVTNDQKLSGLK